MALVPNPHVVPPGGFHFPDHSGGEAVKIEGDGFDDVAKKVLQHRLTNGRPPGNPAQELIDYVCGNWGHFCRETNPAEIAPNPARVGASLANRCAAWMARFYASARADRGVSLTESQRRAEICVACPHNTRLSGCGSCIENLQRLFFVWRRDRPLPLERDLHACQILSQHNGAAALANDLPPVEADVNDQLPGRCWRKIEP